MPKWSCRGAVSSLITLELDELCINTSIAIALVRKINLLFLSATPLHPPKTQFTCRIHCQQSPWGIPDRTDEQIPLPFLL